VSVQLLEQYMENLKQELKKMIVDELKLPDVAPQNIKDDDHLFGEGLGLDSLDVVELVVLIQKKYGVQIQDMEEGKKAFTSIQALAKYISENKE
jgi:acyl carrier protein